MRHDAFDEGDARGEVNAADDSVFIASDIEDEYDQVFFGSGCVHTVEMLFEFCKMLRLDAPQVVVPVAQRFFCFWVAFHEDAKSSWRDDVHPQNILQFVMYFKLSATLNP